MSVAAAAHLEQLLSLAAVVDASWARVLEYHERGDLDRLIADARLGLTVRMLRAAAAVVSIDSDDVLAVAVNEFVARSSIAGAAPPEVPRG
jgi:hypothetical protein